MDSEFKVVFWGVRGSYPAPGPHTVCYGGNTTCVEVRVNGQIIVIDAGSGIINLGKDLARRATESNQSLNLTMLYTHLHHDHTQGIPFFAPMHIPGSVLNMYGPAHLEEELCKVMAPPNFPMDFDNTAAEKNITSIKQTQMIVIGDQPGDIELMPAGNVKDRDKVVIRTMLSYAHPGYAFNFRISWQDKSFVFASDTEGYVSVDRRLANFAIGADLIVHDAQYTEEHYLGLKPGLGPTQGFGHSTPEMAAKLAKTAQVKQLAITHYDPNYDDATVANQIRVAQEHFPNALGAFEGLEIDLIETGKPEEAPCNSPVAQGKLAAR